MRSGPGHGAARPVPAGALWLHPPGQGEGSAAVFTAGEAERSERCAVVARGVGWRAAKPRDPCQNAGHLSPPRVCLWQGIQVAFLASAR